MRLRTHLLLSSLLVLNLPEIKVKETKFEYKQDNSLNIDKLLNTIKPQSYLSNLYKILGEL